MPSGRKYSHPGPWLPIGPFRVWLRHEAMRTGSTNALCDALGIHYKQMLRWLKLNKWVPFDTVDRVMVARNQMWTDIYDIDDLVSSGAARGLPRTKGEGHNGGDTDRQVPVEERVRGEQGVG
jgi:hypothetical protein